MPRYNGELLLKELCLFAGAYQTSTSYILFTMSIIRFCIPYIKRVFDYGTPFGFNTNGLIFSICEAMANILYIIQNYSFIIIGLVDFQRRLHMIRACGSMLTPYKDSYQIKY